MREKSAEYRILLENLVQRAGQDPRLGQLLTPNEIAAINEARSLLATSFQSLEFGNPQSQLNNTTEQQNDATEVIETAEPPAESEIAQVQEILPTEDGLQANEETPRQRLVTTSLTSVPSDESRVCIDFGTAYSKATVTTGSFNESASPVALPLGQIAAELAGTPQLTSAYTLDSCLYACDDMFWFGPRALFVSNQEREPSRERFDSPKSLIVQHGFSNLREMIANERIVPGQIQFTYRDLLLLYLAYLTHIVMTVLKAQGHDPLIIRRFALPSCQDDRMNEWHQWMTDLMARAQLLADSMNEEWHSGLPIEVARRLVDALDETNVLPTQLVACSVHEALAASNSVLRQQWSGNRLFVVADIGAGTTDVAGFWVRQPPDDDVPLIVALLEGSVLSHAGAGDMVDDALIGLVLDKAGITTEDPAYANLVAQARRNIRARKEAVFSDGLADIDAGPDIIETVERDELLSNTSVQKVLAGIHNSLLTCFSKIGLAAIDQLGSQIHLVITGGSAKLPIFHGMSEFSIDLDGRHVPVVRTEHVPSWITDQDAELGNYFNQLAVSIGGALPELPKLANMVRPDTLGPTVHHAPAYQQVH